MNVKLLRNTPDPERTIAAAGRLCYAPVGADALFEEMSDAEITKLLTFLIKVGHLSAIEHASFTFAIEGVSRACTHQLVRHRLASYNQQSQRYVTYENLDFITPPTIAGNKDAAKAFTLGNKAALTVYKELLAKGVPAEDARYILPNAAETKIVVTMNARELLHFFTLRCCNRAQWEIRELAVSMLDIVKELAPTVFAAAGPSCVRNTCPEGSLTCGKPWPKHEY
ncbi:MAG: FAD-dependent thymidylate synthase [Actinomycetota bacterium]